MTNKEAVDRVQQKCDYLTRKLEGCTDERQRFYLQKDLDALTLSVAALEYTVAMAEYEASQTPR